MDDPILGSPRQSWARPRWRPISISILWTV